ncbi:hypothetical protein INT48_009615 [Thamnidium elegans]|uniref:Uncharacterized protein n=1 Tax=Thamnidium elegans TaxID=101142 RepID=A0A8H7SLG7_9FUNG|nr:hypothetical protein INT48_009615 [Thamnidium elegans]
MKYIPSFTTIKRIYIALVIAGVIKCFESERFECKIFIQFQLLCLSSYLLKNALDVFCKYLPHVTIFWCYLYYGIGKLYRRFVTYIALAAETVVVTEPREVEHAAPAVKPVVATAKSIATAANSPTAKPVDTKSESDFEPKVYPDSNFSKSITTLNTWIAVNKFNELSCIGPTILRNYFETDFKTLSKSILIELFTIDRRSRLQGLLRYINDIEQDSSELVTALSRIMAQSLGFPDGTEEHMNSYFQFVVPMLTKALQSCRDSFVCDYVLYNLMDFPTVNSVLENDFIQFFDNKFMKPLGKPKRTLGGVFKHAMYNIKHFIGTSPYGPDTLLVDHYTKDMIRQLKQINATLNGQMKKKKLSPPASPVSIDQDDRCPSSPPLLWDKQHPGTKDLAERKMDFTDFNPENMERINAVLQQASEDIKNAEASSSRPSDTALKRPENNNLYSELLDSLKQRNKEAKIMSHKPSASKDVTLDYWKFLNQPYVLKKEISESGLDLFEDTVQEMRLVDVQMQAKLKKLFASEKIPWLNRLQGFAESGLLSSSATEVLQQLYVSFIKVIENMIMYQDYIVLYEKGYTIRQLISFIKMYKYEIKRVCQMNDKIKLKGYGQICSLRILTIASTCNVWNLKYVYERFALLSPAFYKNEMYEKQIETVYNDMFKLAKENMNIEKQEIEQVSRGVDKQR